LPVAVASGGTPADAVRGGGGFCVVDGLAVADGLWVVDGFGVVDGGGVLGGLAVLGKAVLATAAGGAAANGSAFGPRGARAAVVVGFGKGFGKGELIRGIAAEGGGTDSAREAVVLPVSAGGGGCIGAAGAAPT
jgi:hypothetical protein